MPFSIFLSLPYTIFTNPSARVEYDTIFMRSLNSEFSFSLTSCLTMSEGPSLPCYLPIAWGRISGFIPFTRVLVLCEMQSASSRIWTCVAVSISYDDNHYTTGIYLFHILLVYWTIFALFYLYIFVNIFLLIPLVCILYILNVLVRVIGFSLSFLPLFGFSSFVWWHIKLRGLFNAKAKLVEEQKWYYLTYSSVGKGFIPFPKSESKRNGFTGVRTHFVRGYSLAL